MEELVGDKKYLKVPLIGYDFSLDV